MFHKNAFEIYNPTWISFDSIFFHIIKGVVIFDPCAMYIYFSFPGDNWYEELDFRKTRNRDGGVWRLSKRSAGQNRGKNTKKEGGREAAGERLLVA